MSNKNSYSSIAISGSIWTILEKVGANGISFVVNIVLARLLMPDDYGAIAMISVFISISDILVESGLGSALIQNKDTTNLDFSTIFIFNIFFSIAIYIFTFLIAPFVARYYDMQILSPVLRVMSISVIISGINNVQQSIVSKKMIFKKFFFSTIIGTIVSGILGIIAACYSMGIWAIVIQQLSNRIIDTTVLWFTVKWRPELSFSIRRFVELFNFGWKLLAKSLIDAVFNNLYTLIIAKTYNSAIVGFYNKGQNFPSFISGCINTPMQKVLFPLFSSIREDEERLNNYYKKAIKIGCFVIVPMMLGLVAISDNLIIILLTDKWKDSIVFCKLWCACYCFTPILIESQQLVNSLGHSEEMLKIEILQKIIALLLIAFSYKYGLIYLMVTYLVYVAISTLMNMLVVSKYINYSLSSQLKDVFVYYSISLVVCFSIGVLNIGTPIITVILQIIAGIVLYIVLSLIFCKDTLFYFVNILKAYLKRYFSK